MNLEFVGKDQEEFFFSVFSPSNIGYIPVGFGCAQVKTPCEEQKRHNALAERQSWNPSAIV